MSVAKFPSQLYNFLVRTVDPKVPTRLRPLWEHEAGLKTIFFWAPFSKWIIVLAGFKDLLRPAELLSPEQCASIGLTSVLGARFAMVIRPKNWTLFSVSVFVATTQFVQVFRAMHYRHKNGLKLLQ